MRVVWLSFFEGDTFENEEGKESEVETLLHLLHLFFFVCVCVSVCLSFFLSLFLDDTYILCRLSSSLFSFL